jgi:hypothetical protein
MKPENKTKSTPRKESPPGGKTMPGVTQEWVLTVSSLTGQVTKIERLDMGRREEVSATEYAALAATYPGVLSPTALSAGTTAATADPAIGLYSSYSDPYGYGRIYWQGMYDCASYIASTLKKGTTEEQAYVREVLDQLSAGT